MVTAPTASIFATNIFCIFFGLLCSIPFEYFIKILFLSFFFAELSDKDSPALKPYPSWQSHQAVNPSDVPDIVSPFHIKVDRCNRLWAVDTGIEGFLNGIESKRLAPARILIFDLRTDDLIRKYTLPVNLNSSVFSNIVVDDNDCDDTFAYVADAGTPPSLTVYSFKLNDAWQVKHNFFNIDPLAGNYLFTHII